MRFFLDEYSPTPLFSPWNGDGGFLSDSGTSVETIIAFRNEGNPRFMGIRDAVRAVDQIPLMSEFRQKRDRAKELEKKKKARSITDLENDELKTVTTRVKQIKQLVVTRIRGGFPDSSLGWLDSCLAIAPDGFTASPLLGSGGVDGRLDFGNNFLVNCREILARPSAWEPQLVHALFGTPVTLEKSSIGQFSPGQIGAPNSTQGFEGVSLINRWDFLLMLEGAVVLSGATARRLGTAESPLASFPFTVRSLASGYGSATANDALTARGELWLPLWSRPASLRELTTIFSEGRAEVGKRPARDGADFARAASSLGVDRGIEGFARLGFLKRSGKAFLAAPLGRFEVTQRRDADLLRQIDSWLHRFRRAVGDKNAPPRFGAALRRLDCSVLGFCRYGGTALFQQILIALGQAERELAVTGGKVGNSKIKPNPLAGLSSAWLDAANDASSEFTIALSLASVHDPERKIGPLRANLEAVDWKKRCRAWAEKDRAVVWNAADLATNLGNTLARRMIDGARADCGHLPLASRFTATLDHVAAFIAEDLDDERIEDLMWGLMLLDAPLPRGGASRWEPSRIEAPPPLPREYALLKLLFLPQALTAHRQGEVVRWRLARSGEPGIRIRPEPRVLPLLRAGRVGEACRIAAQRLRVSGLPSMPAVLPTGVVRDVEWSECVCGHRRARRLAAALLIPIGSDSVNQLVRLVCRQQSGAAGILLNK
jgi:CRISPR-associated protein Csx17